MHLALVLLALALLLPAARAASEGVVAGLAPGETTWSVPPGEWWLVVAAGPSGIAYDLPGQSGAQPAGAPTTGTAGQMVRSADGQIALRVANGTGLALLARPDLFNASVSDRDTYGRVELRGSLEGGCVAHPVGAQPFQIGSPARFLSGPIELVVAAPGMDVALLDGDLGTRTRDRDALQATLDPEHGRDEGMLVQVCGQGAYAIHLDRALATQEESRRVVPGGGALLVVAAALVALWARRTRAAPILLALLLAGCALPDRSVGDGFHQQPSGFVLVPADASWPSADGANLSGLYPTSLRLEMATPEPNASATLRFGDRDLAQGYPGSASGGPPGSDPRSVVSFALNGGLRALGAIDPTVVELRHVAFAGRDVAIPTLARAVTLRVRFTTAKGTAQVENATLAPRAGDLVAGQAFYNRTYGYVGVNPHPGGFLHTLEDGALHAWAAGDRLVQVGDASAPFAPPRPAQVQLLVLTGLGGGVVEVGDEPAAPPFASPADACAGQPWAIVLPTVHRDNASVTLGVATNGSWRLADVQGRARWGIGPDDAQGFAISLDTLDGDGPWSYHDAPPVAVASANDTIVLHDDAAWIRIDLYQGATGEFLGGTPRGCP